MPTDSPTDHLELLRVTTEYVATEDRIRLSGETGDGQTVVTWLTQRLLNLMVPRLTEWLENHGGDALLQEFAQQAAEASLGAEPPVAALDAAVSWCVMSVDITTGTDGAVLVFKSENDAHAVRLTLAAEAMRQWLGIVRGQYLIGAWPTTVWPSWMDETRLAPPQTAGSALH